MRTAVAETFRRAKKDAQMLAT